MSGRSEEQKALSQELRDLEHKRRERLREMMADYDKDEHLPARQAIQERCATIGHQPRSDWHDNGFGVSWRYCSICNARTDITGAGDNAVAEH